MRCLTCGLPLSPARKSCPRCGSAIIRSEEKHLSTASGIVSSVMQEMFKLPEDNRQEPRYQRFQSSHESLMAGVTDLGYTGNMGKTSLFHSTLVRRLLQKRSPRFNLIIATLCVMSGAILLIAVFIISLSLPSSSSQVAAPQSSSAPTSGAVIVTASPSASPTTQPTASPAPGFAGQQYIDNAQMASAIDFSTAQPLQLTTQFYRNQKIYVTFALHPGHNGAVCLLWYLNNQQFTTYTFPADNVSISAYSYAISGIPGPGYVAIYWASSTLCTDKILAQQVHFTII